MHEPWHWMSDVRFSDSDTGIVNTPLIDDDVAAQVLVESGPASVLNVANDWQCVRPMRLAPDFMVLRWKILDSHAQLEPCNTNLTFHAAGGRP